MFSVVLDACVLFPQSLRDLLLRIASEGLFAPLWSDRILEEMRSNVVATGRASPEQAARTVRLMREAFEEAEIDPGRIAALDPAMTNDEKDRHVLATAVASGAELVVTFNLRHFPEDTCSPHGVVAMGPDDFLLDLFDLDPDGVYRVVAMLVDGLRTTTYDEFLEMLERAGVDRFVAKIRDHQERRIRG